jgi:hypothetical protein
MKQLLQNLVLASLLSFTLQGPTNAALYEQLTDLHWVNVLTEVPPEAAAIGISQSSIDSTTRKTLRNYGLGVKDETSNQLPFVYVHVHLVSTSLKCRHSVCVLVEVCEPVNLLRNRATAVASTWTKVFSSTDTSANAATERALAVALQDLCSDWQKANPKQ